MVVLGGDVTGKTMVPIIAYPGYWETKIRGELIRLETREDLSAVEQRSGTGASTRSSSRAMSSTHISSEEASTSGSIPR